MRQEENYIILVNIKRTRLRHWNEEVKPKVPEQLATPSHLLLDVSYKNRKPFIFLFGGNGV
jgi:hypothetical protein